MIALLAVLAMAQAPAPRDTLVAVATRAALMAPTHAAMRWGDLSDVRDALVATYGRRDDTPLWSSRGRVTPQGAAVLSELASANTEGLDPADYDVPRLQSEVARLAGMSATEVADFDVCLSAAVARYALALDRGRLDPRLIYPGLIFRREALDLPVALESAATAAHPDSVFRSLEPDNTRYHLLKAALAQYRRLAADSSLRLRTLPHLRRGDTSAAVPQLRRLLVALGDLPEAAAGTRLATSLVYDAALQRAVGHFQRRQGLSPDGIIGDATEHRLRRPFTDQVRQIELALERWRWLPRIASTPEIIVNVPGFHLVALRQSQAGESTTVRMNVVVGKSVDHDTPLLVTEITGVQFHPPWIIPGAIARDEVRPAVLREPALLVKEGYDLLRGDSLVEPTVENIRRIGAGIDVRQRPGPRNALGHIKFIMPDPEQIFLHDSPERALFARDRRDYSHGCIRLADAVALAQFVLSDQPEWTPSFLATALRGDSTTVVPLLQPVPVFILYQTVVAQLSGDVSFYADIYGQDQSLDETLRRGYPYARQKASPR